MSNLTIVFSVLLVSSPLVCFILLTNINKPPPPSPPPPSPPPTINKDPSTHYILIWTGGKTFNLPYKKGYTVFEENCPRKNCFITENKHLLPSVDEYAAIMFSVPTSSNHPKETIPQKRDPRQRYVFVNFESPLRFRGENAQYVYNNGFYNWTMTFRFDSDLVRRHGEVVKKRTRYQLPTKKDVLRKSGSAAWIVSNCKSVDRREAIAKNLGKHIKLDVYGRCGSKTCPEGEDCFDYVAKNYKFYLSFENSHCRDYTTEKFFKILKRDIIPVVYGGGNYSLLAPAHSFINVEDFNSTKALANYLKMLEKDTESYLKYFEWKKTHDVHKRGLMTWCKLCDMLNDAEQPRKVYENIEYWWYSDELAQCKSDMQLPPIALEDVL